MKTIHIVIIIALVVAIGVILSLIYDADTYSDFDTAWKHPSRSFQIIGVLDTSMPIEYSPRVNTDMFSFYMRDKNERLEKVWFKGSKPQDFELSEKVVLTGKSEDSVFVANSMLLKCPSKYNNEQPEEFKPRNFNGAG
jgi:cytochrome c-type biogenesis protein CcmE